MDAQGLPAPCSHADILARRAWVGASEVSAIAGVNPYAGPLDVYLSKVLDGADLLRHAHRLDRELPIRIGNALEPTMLRLYEERYGRPIRARNVHRTRARCGCPFDVRRDHRALQGEARGALWPRPSLLRVAEGRT